MKPRIIILRIIPVLLGLLLPSVLSAQRGNITIPIGSKISVPLNAEICADTIFANGAGHGILTLADPSCVCSGSVVIPVELLTFSATLQHGMVVLSWATASEQNNHGFEVERQTAGDTWTTLGFVQGHGSSGAHHSYAFTDDLEDLPAYCCLMRYRLKQIDFDGQYEYSPEVDIRLEQPLPRFTLEGYPSPCGDELTVRFTLQEKGAIRMKLYDIAGRVVLESSHDAVLQAGSHSMRLSTAAMPSGQYLLAVESTEGRRTRKIVIQH